MIHETLMGLGKWDLDLSEETPREVMSILDPRPSLAGNLVITATHVPVSLGESILGLARYSGVFRKQTGDFSIAGVGMSYYLGDESKIGKYGVFGVASPGALSAWADLLSGDLTKGFTGSHTGHVFTYPLGYLKDALDDVMTHFGAEWRIHPTGVIDFGDRGDLYRMTPQTIILPKVGDAGRGISLTGIEGALQIERDGEDYARRVFLYDSDDILLATADGGIADADVQYRSFFGGAIRRDKALRATGSEPVTAAAEDFEANRYARQEFTLSSDQYDVGDGVEVGDNLFVFDKARGITDLANEQFFNGQIIYPEVIRCVGLSWPVRQGMGVFFRRWVKPASTWEVEWTDLTPYIQFEDSATRVEVGARPRPMVKKERLNA